MAEPKTTWAPLAENSLLKGLFSMDLYGTYLWLNTWFLSRQILLHALGHALPRTLPSLLPSPGLRKHGLSILLWQPIRPLEVHHIRSEPTLGQSNPNHCLASG
jgi:hypothetical protein